MQNRPSSPLVLRIERFFTRRWVTRGMPPDIYQVVNAARLYARAWEAQDQNRLYESTFMLLNAVDDLESHHPEIGPPLR